MVYDNIWLYNLPLAVKQRGSGKADRRHAGRRSERAFVWSIVRYVWEVQGDGGGCAPVDQGGWKWSQGNTGH